MREAMPSHRSDPPAPAGHRDARSAKSLAFEAAWDQAREDGAIPLRSAIGLKRFAKFARWFAIIEPDRAKPALPFRLVGSGFFDFLGVDLTGADYLDLADPAIRQPAYDYVTACLAHPCGLWQRTPVLTSSGGMILYEYTILPISKTSGDADHIAVYVDIDPKVMEAAPIVDRVEHSTVWQWIDIGLGVPDTEPG